MENLNAEQVKKALKSCVDMNCKECPMTERRGCAVKLHSHALKTIIKQEAKYNELYELCESYRKELGEVKADTVRKLADLLWEGESEKLNISVGGNYYDKQEFIDKIAKERLERKES